MDINKALFETYKEYWPRLQEALKGIKTVELKISYPHLLYVFPEYLQTKYKLLVVGKQTGGWGFDNAEYWGTSRWDDSTAKLNDCSFIEKLIWELIEVYKNFPRKKYGKPFLNASVKLFQKLNPSSTDENGFVWSNLVKVDQDQDTPKAFITKTVCREFPVLRHEIRIARPDVVIFFTSYTYDDILKMVFPGLELIPTGGFNGEFLSRVVHKELPERSFRTYHPMPLQCSGQLEDVLNQIVLWPSLISLTNKLKPSASKTTLRDKPIGAVDGNQILKAKCKNGEYQLWKCKIGYGVVQIVNNKYVTILPCRHKEEHAREVFNALCSSA